MGYRTRLDLDAAGWRLFHSNSPHASDADRSSQEMGPRAAAVHRACKSRTVKSRLAICQFNVSRRGVSYPELHVIQQGSLAGLAGSLCVRVAAERVVCTCGKSKRGKVQR